MNQTTTYHTPGISTGHCRAAILEELARLDGINSVVVDLEARLIRVTAEQIDDAAVIAAVYQAGRRGESMSNETAGFTPRRYCR